MPSAAAAIRTPLRGALRCRSLSFSYSAGAQLLEDINCDLGVGEHVCICGPSGAGTSTLLRLLSLSLPPSSGRLWFDDVEAVLWASEALRAQFGIVMQGDRLFAGSIAQNITGFEAIPDLRRVRDAALRAAVWDDIAEMPMHVHTPVGAAGHGLSAGQLQRIIIARALYRRPRILFLDEATAHLDAATEERVLDGVSDLGITTVSVAHREGPLARSDRQIILPRRV
jgi:ATP-binding cassette subfamily B protein RaxB